MGVPAKWLSGFIKALAAKPDDLNLISKTHRIESKSFPWTSTGTQHSMFTFTEIDKTQKYIKTNVKK